MNHQMNLSQQPLGRLHCRVFEPSDGNLKPELVVILCHGFGAPGDDLVPLGQWMGDQYPELGKRVHFVFPEAPLSLAQMGMPGGRAWWMIDTEALQRSIESGDPRDLSQDLPEGMPEASEMVSELVKQLMETHQISEDRVVLGGFSQGSMVTTDVALRMENAPGALIVMSGTLVCEPVWSELSQKREMLKILQSHGRQDPILPFEAARALRSLFLQAGFEHQFLPFDGVHSIPEEVLRASADLILSLAESKKAIAL